MRIIALCAFLRGEEEKKEVLMAVKNGGRGHGHRGLYGGEVKEGESVVEALVREIEEECGMIIREDDLTQVGIVTIQKGDAPEFQLNIFVTTKWEGEPVGTDEMHDPQWFRKFALPESEMWSPDRCWLPLVLAPETFNASFIAHGKRARLINVSVNTKFK